MFEAEVARERAQGHRGPFTRFAGPISDPAEASRVIREMSLGLFILAALQVAVGFSQWPLLAVIMGLIIAVPAALLLLTRHRAAAVGVALIGAGLFLSELLLRAVAGPLPAIPAILFYILYFVLTVRALQAAFLRHRYLSVPIQGAPPSGT